MPSALRRAVVSARVPSSTRTSVRGRGVRTTTCTSGPVRLACAIDLWRIAYPRPPRASHSHRSLASIHSPLASIYNPLASSSRQSFEGSSSPLMAHPTRMPWFTVSRLITSTTVHQTMVLRFRHNARRPTGKWQDV